MNFKKRVNGSWVDTPSHIHKTSTDTLITIPAVIYPTGTTATVGLKGNTVQSGTPTPQNPVMPNGTGERTGNLFDKYAGVLVGNGAVVNILSTGIRTIIETAGSNRYSSIKLDNELLGKTITISSTITQSANNKGQIRLFYANGRYATSLITAITTAGQTGYITRTYTMPSSIPSGSDGIVIVLSADRNGDGNVGDYVEYADLMIVEGSTAPSSYIPYGIKIPISSANTTTPVYLGEVQSTRRIKKLVLTGEEGTIYSNPAIKTSNAFYMTRADYLDGTLQGFCTHYPTVSQTSAVEGVYFGKNISIFTDLSDGLDTVVKLKAYLATQYANGTPVTVWYVLATEETAVVNEPLMKIGDYADEVSNISVPVTAGGDTLSVGTTVQPSEVTVGYKGWHPAADVHERNNGAWT